VRSLPAVRFRGSSATCMSSVRIGNSPAAEALARARAMPARGGEMSDLLYVGRTIVVFAVLTLLVKGVEHLQR
jgi:hypothetical protein